MTTDSRFFLPRYSSSHIPENMSLDRSSDGSSSPSKDDKFASHKWSRSNTVRKVNSTPNYTKEEAITVKRTSVDDTEVTTRRIFDNLNVEHSEKLRKYLLENTYRQSLESISEYKTKESFATQHLPSRSFESPSSDCTDYMLKTTAAADANNSRNVILSESSSYLSWIESLNSDNLTATEVFTTTDGRTGEWNNFWLNYNNARNLYLRQQNSCSCNSISTTDNTAATDEFLDARSIQKEPSLAHNPDDLLYMTRADMLETIKCCQKIIEILQNAMKTRVDSARDATQQEREVLQRYSLTNLQKQKYNNLSNKPNLQQTGSCINALFNTGVADILKKMVMKRRDSTENQPSETGFTKTVFPHFISNNFR